jgi:predicted DNA-binding ribbon-helix-helix protein
MWKALRDIARRERCRIHDICSLIHLRKEANTSLTAGIRVFLMLYYRAAATEEGHQRAGHGSFENMLRRAQMAEEEMHFRRGAHIYRLGQKRSAPVNGGGDPAIMQGVPASSQDTGIRQHAP